MKTTITKAISLLLGLILLISILCGCALSEDVSGKIQSEEFFLENSDGTFTHGEIVVPSERGTIADTKIPLVVMSHGIYGSMNSGGARQLSEKLAESGIAAIRVDFNRCITKDPAIALAKDKSGRTNSYTISEMLESNDLAIHYAIDKYNADPDRIGLYGRSFGGRLTMAMGNESIGGFDYKSMFLIAPAGNEYALIHYFGGQKNWDKMRAKAQAEGFVQKNGLTFTPKWFEDYYRYNPALTGDGFDDKPVILYYNTKDTVVEPKTSLDCASAYSNIKIYKVITDDGHGYEMSYKHSKLKDEIMNRVVNFFSDTL